MSLLDKIKTNSTIDQASILSKSKLFNDKDLISTSVPMLNVALSGDLNGGLAPGITEIAGPSKYFKSNFAILLAKAYQDKYKDSVILFYDSEFGTPKAYFSAFGIDMTRVFHAPLTDVEIFKIDLMKQVKSLSKGERVIIILDSLGQLASRKEVEDTDDGKTVTDMSRAKALKSVFRLVTPHLRLKDIPMVVVNHTYKEIGLFPKEIAGGGTGLTYAADTIWIMGRRQEKEKDEVTGYNFLINVEKSRFVKEKSQIPITVTFEGGIEQYSGLFDLALEAGFIIPAKKDGNVTKGWYTLPGSDKKFTEATALTKEFCEPLLKNKKFQEFVRTKYEISSRPIFHMDQSVDTEGAGAPTT